MKLYATAMLVAGVLATVASAHAREKLFSGESLYGPPSRGALDPTLSERAIIDEAARNGDTFRRDNAPIVNGYSSTVIGCQNIITSTTTYDSAYGGQMNGTTNTSTQTGNCNNSGNGTATTVTKGK